MNPNAQQGVLGIDFDYESIIDIIQLKNQVLDLRYLVAI